MTRERIEFYAALAERIANTAAAAIRQPDSNDLPADVREWLYPVIGSARAVSARLTEAARPLPYSPDAT